MPSDAMTSPQLSPPDKRVTWLTDQAGLDKARALANRTGIPLPRAAEKVLGLDEGKLGEGVMSVWVRVPRSCLSTPDTGPFTTGVEGGARQWNAPNLGFYLGSGGETYPDYVMGVWIYDVAGEPIQGYPEP
jgi:hypothetical protein